MVSTRGIKLKFSENERVLCYEPDPTKAKVLYDSKVLNVVINKDHRGRKAVEYLIHFQGWNSSWDRYVSEEYVLKDTPENRQLQKDLAEQSQLQLGAYLYRRDRKKHRNKPSDRTAPSSDDGSSGSPTRMDTDDGGHGVSSSSEDDSSLEEDSVPIELTQELREILEQDYNLINIKHKLLKLPAEPNVVNILESYWRHYCTTQICDLNEKSFSRHRYQYSANHSKRKPEDVHRNLTVCREVLDGIRIYFDFTLHDLLLYKPEQNQIKTSHASYNTTVQLEKDETNNKHDVDYVDCNYPNNSSNNEEEFADNKISSRRRTLRSNKSVDTHSNGNAHSENPPVLKPCTSFGNGASDQSNAISKLISWRLLPEHVYSQPEQPPCLVYGAVHLTRLFVKLPELFNNSNIEEGKLKTLLQHLDAFLEFMNDHKEWFGEKFYIDK